MIKKTGKILVLIALSIIFIVGCSKSGNEKAGNGKQLTIYFHCERRCKSS